MGISLTLGVHQSNSEERKRRTAGRSNSSRISVETIVAPPSSCPGSFRRSAGRSRSPPLLTKPPALALGHLVTWRTLIERERVDETKEPRGSSIIGRFSRALIRSHLYDCRIRPVAPNSARSAFRTTAAKQTSHVRVTLSICVGRSSCQLKSN